MVTPNDVGKSPLIVAIRPKFQTWGQVQRFDLWPPYVAVESPVEPVRKFFPSRVISEVRSLPFCQFLICELRAQVEETAVYITQIF